MKPNSQISIPHLTLNCSNVKVHSPDIAYAKNMWEEHGKAIATLEENSLLAKHHMLRFTVTKYIWRKLKLLTGHRCGDKD